MECFVCVEAFDDSGRRPKVLPCGHTLCLRCLEQMDPRRCPLDNKEFEFENLPDNYLVLEHSTSAANDVAVRAWCQTCNEVADEGCLDDDHAVCSLKRARAEDAGLLLEELKKDEANVDGLRGALDAAGRELQDWRAELQRGKDCLVAAKRRLKDAAKAATAVWKEAMQAAREGLACGAAFLAAQQAAQLMPALADPSATCSVTVRRGADGDVAWRGEVRPAEDAAARLLLCSLACRGVLQQAEQLPPVLEETATEPAAPAPELPAPAPDPPAPAPEPAARPAQPPAPRRIDELNVSDFSDSYPGERQEEKAAALARVRWQGVRRMVGVWCKKDRAWVLDLLRSAAPTLEELHVMNPREEHLRAVYAMPRLQRLQLWCKFRALNKQPPVLAALPQASLRWLHVWDLPRPTLESLLQAHSATLDVLRLNVGTPGDEGFPYNCNDLDALLGQCGLRVTRVVLERTWTLHDRAACPAQVSAVRRVLPGATVQCTKCDRVAEEVI